MFNLALRIQIQIARCTLRCISVTAFVASSGVPKHTKPKPAAKECIKFASLCCRALHSPKMFNCDAKDCVSSAQRALLPPQHHSKIQAIQTDIISIYFN